MYESGKSSKKRKLSEFRDPDYDQNNETKTQTSTATCETIAKLQKKNESESASTSGASTSVTAPATQSTESPKPSAENLRLQRTREIITREFQREISHHKKELEEVDKSIEDAIKIFDKLRYTLVKNFYQKQEIEISTKDAAQLRGEHTLFVNEPNGPQLPLHPSLKQIIGKRPSSLADALRMYPKRTAAQNAQQKIDEVTNALSNKHKDREQRRLQKIIRDKGIVIDHSKPASENTQQNQDLEQAQLLSQAVVIEQSKPIVSIPQNPVAIQPLNTTRLNNKVKHLIVVGNTSQYIGNENITSNSSSEVAGQRLSHKWLVYVQAKDPALTPLERLVDKIRFFLHDSYRPNNVIDILSPPFQLSRRGWGEFPVRLQIYFNANLQQKPVQLIHNLVLDKTLTGLQTMGAETLVEVWLRPLPKSSYNNNNNNSINSTITASSVFNANYNKSNDDYDGDYSDNKNNENQLNKNRTNSIGLAGIKDVLDDDNIFDFLNRIEATPSSLGSDIEKIEPTISLNDSFTSIVTSPTKLFFGNSPQKKNANKSPVKNDNNKSITNTSLNTKPTSIATSSSTLGNAISTTTTSCKTLTASAPTITIKTFKNCNDKFSIIKPNEILHIPSQIFTIAPSSSKATTTTIPITSNSNKINTVTSTSSSFSTLKSPRFGTLKIYPQPATPKPLIICLNTINDKTITTTTVTSSTRPATGQKVANNGKIVVQTNAKNVQFIKTIEPGTIKPVQTFENKVVQLVDAQGKIKYVQMLVAKKENLTKLIAHNNKVLNLIPAALKNVVFGTATTTTTASIITPNINLINNRNVQNNVTTSKTTTAKVTSPFPKNTPNIFLKGGKLFVRDAQQMKLKQQQKQQTSLLKPQVSLLKQQQQQQQQQKPTAYDHNYAPHINDLSNPAITKLNLIKSTSKNFIFNQKNIIIRASKEVQQEQEEPVKCERVKLEDSFNRLKFSSIRAAVEFLLRRLPLIVTNNFQLMQDFVFVRCRTEIAFQQLPAFKQLSCEWLRAKYIAECLVKNEHIKLLQQNNETVVYWTTREIVLFARLHAYTPPIKSMGGLQEAVTNYNRQNDQSQKFADILRKEVNLEMEQVQYETLTSNEPISSWMNEINAKFKVEDISANDELEIDVVGAENTLASISSKTTKATTKTNRKNSNEGCTLAVPRVLEPAAELVQEICRNINIPLQTEEVAEQTQQPLAKIMLAQCVRVFLEQLVRRGFATRKQEPSPKQSITPCELPTVRLQDIAKALVEFGQPAEETGNNYVYSEYDFLTNCYLGVPQFDNESDDEHA